MPKVGRRMQIRTFQNQTVRTQSLVLGGAGVRRGHCSGEISNRVRVDQRTVLCQTGRIKGLGSLNRAGILE